MSRWVDRKGKKSIHPIDKCLTLWITDWLYLFIETNTTNMVLDKLDCFIDGHQFINTIYCQCLSYRQFVRESFVFFSFSIFDFLLLLFLVVVLTEFCLWDDINGYLGFWFSVSHFMLGWDFSKNLNCHYRRFKYLFITYWLKQQVTSN